jgi:hypothetical protein
MIDTYQNSSAKTQSIRAKLAKQLQETAATYGLATRLTEINMSSIIRAAAGELLSLLQPKEQE